VTGASSKGRSPRSLRPSRPAFQLRAFFIRENQRSFRRPPAMPHLLPKVTWPHNRTWISRKGETTDLPTRPLAELVPIQPGKVRNVVEAQGDLSRVNPSGFSMSFQYTFAQRSKTAIPVILANRPRNTSDSIPEGMGYSGITTELDGLSEQSRAHWNVGRSCVPRVPISPRLGPSRRRHTEEAGFASQSACRAAESTLLSHAGLARERENVGPRRIGRPTYGLRIDETAT